MIEVAAAVIQRADGSFLLAQRPQGKVYAGYWEFPGGKIERGEAAAGALSRELHEELGIDIERAYPWITREYIYPHGHVRLHFFRVVKWKGEPHPREEQAITWDASVEPMLPANAPVLASLALPVEYAVTDATTIGVAEQLARLEKRLKEGLKLVQVREPGLKERELFTRQVIGLAHRYGCKVMVKVGEGDGLHLTAVQLMQLKERPAGFTAASCHTREELERAMALELAFAVLGPVRDKSPALGWSGFRQIAAGSSIPVYAIGGLTRADMDDAWRAGAHGLAMIRGAWA